MLSKLTDDPHCIQGQCVGVCEQEVGLPDPTWLPAGESLFPPGSLLLEVTSSHWECHWATLYPSGKTLWGRTQSLPKG